MSNEGWIVLGALGGATILVLVRVLAGGLPRGVGLTTPVGPVNFDFSKSFASSITLFGALLTTITAAKVDVSKAPHFSAATYAALSIFFAVLLVVAPFIYRTLSATSEVTSAQGASDLQFQGFAGTFLLSTALTVWAVLGQIITILFFLTDIQSSAVFEVFLFVALAPATALVAVYVWSTVPAVLAIQAKTSTHEAALKAAMRMAQVPRADSLEVKAPLPGWTPL